MIKMKIDLVLHGRYLDYFLNVFHHYGLCMTHSTTISNWNLYYLTIASELYCNRGFFLNSTSKKNRHSLCQTLLKQAWKLSAIKGKPNLSILWEVRQIYLKKAISSQKATSNSISGWKAISGWKVNSGKKAISFQIPISGQKIIAHWCNWNNFVW